MSARVTNSALRQYLLGHLADASPGIDPGAVDEISDLLVSDDDTIAERMSRLEAALIDRRVRRTLPARWLTAVREDFVWTPRRRRMLGLAVGLSGLSRRQVRHAWAAEGRQLRRRRFSGWLERLFPSLAVPKPVAVWAGAAAALTLVVTLSLVWQMDRLRSPDAVVAEAWLVAIPNVRGGSAQTVVVGDASLVRVRLEIGVSEFDTYRAEVRVVDTDVKIVWMQERLLAETRRGREVVTLDLPRDLLVPGSYVAILEGIRSGQAPEFVARYPFSVPRQ